LIELKRMASTPGDNKRPSMVPNESPPPKILKKEDNRTMNINGAILDKYWTLGLRDIERLPISALGVKYTKDVEKILQKLGIRTIRGLSQYRCVRCAFFSCFPASYLTG
jgi:hypothetical protein